MKKISVITPTRARAGRALNMAQSAIVKANEREDLRLWFWIDDDDPEKDDYLMNLKEGPYSDYIFVEIGPRQPLGKCWNHLAKHSLQEADIFMMGNDDQVFITQGWDDIIRKKAREFADDIYVLYPHDMNNGKCTFPIVSNRMVTELGYFVPEIFEFLAHDTYLERLGSGMGRLNKIDEFQLDHQHFAFGKSKYDQTYSHWRETGATKRDVELLNKSNDLIASDIEKLKALMK
jgi:hypothetical protein